MTYIHKRTYIYTKQLVLNMRFIKQQLSLPIKNTDCKTTTVVKHKHSRLLPNSIRCLIVGPSNCGKTNVMLSLLEHENGLKFENVYIYSKSLHQPKYQYLKRVLSKTPNIGFYTFSNNCDVKPPEQAKRNSIFIFDDVACEKQDNVRSYFCMGRHNHIDSFYLCQTYTRIPKHLIRDNANFIIIFKQDDMNLKHIFNDHVNTDMYFSDFQKLCAECWKEKYGFVVIDKDSPIHCGRYRRGFDSFVMV